MPKLNTADTTTQEGIENVQACLGNALVYLRLIDLRIRLAACSQPDVLAPAIEDLSSAHGLIRQAQAGIGRLIPSISRAR